MAYQLARDAISHDTVEALEDLLASAKTGELVGIVFGVMLKRRRYMVNSAGEARRDPTFALGMCQMMSAEMRALVTAESGPVTQL